MEKIGQYLNRLPEECIKVVTTFEGMDHFTLANIKAKLTVFYKCKFKCKILSNPALAFSAKFEGICCTCSIQGHSASDSQMKKQKSLKQARYQVFQTSRAHYKCLPRTQKRMKRIQHKKQCNICKLLYGRLRRVNN